MGVVHGLQGNSGIIAIEVAILHKIFDGVDDLTNLEHASPREYETSTYLLQQVCLLQPCLEHCEKIKLLVAYKGKYRKLLTGCLILKSRCMRSNVVDGVGGCAAGLVTRVDKMFVGSRQWFSTIATARAKMSN